MRYCENCGKEIPDGSSFCPECGSHQTVISTKSSFDLKYVAILVISVIQMFLWNAESIDVALFISKMHFSINDVLSTASSLGEYVDFRNMKYLNVINIVFYACAVLVIIYSLCKMFGTKISRIPAVIIEIVFFLLLMYALIRIAFSSEADYVSFNFMYYLLIISTGLNALAAFKLK